MKTNKDLAEFANKKFGQNFLKNQVYVHKIIQAIPNDNLPIAEIGPGLGDLTKELIELRDVTAFEVDRRLCKHLHKEFELPIQQKVLTLECGDALEYWGEGNLLDEPYHLVANLPYYIATKLILKALHDPLCQSILTMVQKEVAIKFSAKSGDRNFSALTVLAETAGGAQLCFEVEPEAFVPPPKVTSAVLLIRKQHCLHDKGFEEFLKVAFKQPRKKLVKNLSTHYDKEEIVSVLENLQLHTTIRPHEAKTSTYHHLYSKLKDNLDGKSK